MQDTLFSLREPTVKLRRQVMTQKYKSQNKTEQNQKKQAEIVWHIKENTEKFYRQN